MKPEQLVCSLENGKTLQELGVNVDSYFKHTDCRTFKLGHPSVDLKSEIIVLPHDTCTGEWYGSSRKYIAPAYTVGELGEMLPKEIVKDDIFYDFQSTKTMTGKRWIASYVGGGASSVWSECSTREADARALMLIWLIENGHLTTEEINR